MEPWEYQMINLGFNYRITDIQCSLGISQLKKLPIFIKKRVEIAKKYDKAFQNTILKPLYTFDGKSSYHLYVVQLDFSKISLSRTDLFNKLNEKNIGVQVHYMPINKQPYYISLGYGNEITPQMDKYYKECFSIPIYPLLDDKEQDYIIRTIFEILNV